MSKTFESIGNCLELSVGKVDNESLVGVELRHTNGRWVGIASLAPYDIPAIMLALCEAAGVTPSTHDNPVIYNGSWLESIAADLKELIAHQERITAEAKAHAELEAEALELFQAWRKSHNLPMVEDWDMTPSFKPEWLAVARKARDLRAEK